MVRKLRKQVTWVFCNDCTNGTIITPTSLKQCDTCQGRGGKELEVTWYEDVKEGEE